MHKVIIDRLLWLRGEGSDASRLIRPCDGKKCCLGFAGEQCGMSSDDLLDKEYFTCDDPVPEALKFLVDNIKNLPTSHAAFTLMIANDIKLGEDCPNDHEFPGNGKPFEPFQSESEREAFLTREFLKHGIEIEFIN